MHLTFRDCALAAAIVLTSACGSVVVESGSSGSGDEPSGSGPCPAAAEEACYSGPAGTEQVGACGAGVRHCAADGDSWSSCIGEVVPTAEVCSTAADESCDGAGECSGNGLWARDLEGEEVTGSGAAVAADRWGNVLVTGYFDGAFEVSGLSLASDVGAAFVMKLDPAGKGLWARQTQGAAYGSAVGADADGNVIVAGSFHDGIDLGAGPLQSAGASDLFVAKYDPSGELLWSRQYGGPGHQWPEDMAVDAQGNVVLIGGLHDGADFGDGYAPAAGETDFFVLKLDPSGKRLWSRQLGTTGYDYGLGIAVGSGGALALTGSFEGTLDLGGGALVPAGSDDVFVAWLSPDGAHVWSQRHGGGGHDLGKAIAVGPSDTVVVAGLSTGLIDLGTGPLSGGGDYDAFVAWYAKDGECLGAHVFGAPGAMAEALGVAADSAGNVVVAGMVTGTVSFGGAALTTVSSDWTHDLFVVKLDPAGQHVHSHLFGDEQQQLTAAVEVDATGSALVTGSFSGSIDFGTGPLPAPEAGTGDLFIAKLMP